MSIVVKKYYATWCGPCRMLNPVFEKISKEFPQISVEHIDIDENPLVTENANVRSVPTVVIEKNGVEIERFVGVQSEIAYKNAINEHIQS